MKKIITLLLAVLMVASLAACSSNNAPAQGSEDAAAAGVKLKILDTEYVTEDYAIAIAKENTDLLDGINAALQKLTAAGTV